MPPRRRIAIDVGRAAVYAWMAAQGAAARPTLIAPTTRDTTPNTTPEPDRSTIATAVRYLLEELESRAPGRTLEVRIPPFGAVQCLEGPRHTRGTPPGVVEMDAHTWLAIATGSREWHEALASGDVKASGERANLAALLPLMTPPKE